MIKRGLLAGIWFSFLILIFLSAADAAILSVTPNKGTIGTTLTVTGSDFGLKKGSIFIGKKRCKVIAWGDTSVEALVSSHMPPRVYDVILDPKSPGPDMILRDAFTIRAPELDAPSHRPHFVSPGDVVTIQGEFFGNGRDRHKVVIANLRGRKKSCRIINWSMNSITFKLPRGIPGIFHLSVINAVGSETQTLWGTFAEPPANPPNLLGSYTGMTTHDNASAVAYNNKLYAFYPHKNDDGNTIAYRIFDGYNWSDGYPLITTPPYNVYLKSKAQINPLVADEVLYVFYTGTNGKLYYLKFDFVAEEDNIVPDPNQDPTKVDQVWQPEQTIPGAEVQDVSGRFAAVYNFTKKWIEIYWTPDSVNVYMKTYSLDTRTWSDARAVAIPKEGNLTIAPYLTAVFNQLEEDDYVTYLSWADGLSGYLAELKDGEVLRHVKSSSWQSVNEDRGPSLADLGNDYLAVIYNNKSDRSYYQKYDKNTHTVLSGSSSVPFTSPQDESWAPTGITFSTKVADEKSPTGFRMDSNFYVFVGNNPVAKDTKWEFVKCAYLGYWMPTSKDGNESNFAAQDLMTDTFELWPVMGVIDMPPYAENGHVCTLAERDTCGTDVACSFKKVTMEGLSTEISAGAYVRSRARSPVEFHVSGGFSGGFEHSQTFTYIHTDTMDANREGTIMVYYLAPKFRIWELEWYDLDNNPTGLTIQSVQVSGAEFRMESFNPHLGPVMWRSIYGTEAPPYLDAAKFPYHVTEVDVNGNVGPEADKERLLSYCKVPTDLGYKQAADTTLSSCTWSPVNICTTTLGIAKDKSVDLGGYFDFKIGAKLKVAFGVEGHLKMMHKTKTETGVEIITSIRGPNTHDSDPNRIVEFHLEGYWLKPSNNGYWVPEYRKEMGDKPWFVTYRVTDGWLQGSGTPIPTPIPFYPSCY